MQVSKRIYSITKHLKGRKLADIGTDHCFLPIFAIKSGKVDRAVGVDVNKGPLESAHVNIAAEGLEDKIELRLGDGFSPLDIGECDIAVISGMGGMLIIKIIEKGLEKAKCFNELILSPQSDFSALRKSLHRLGFEIFKEDMIKDGAKFYPLIIVRPGESARYSQFQYEFGKEMLENPNNDFYEYLEELFAKNEKIINENPLTPERYEEILEQNNFIRGFTERRQ